MINAHSPTPGLIEWPGGSHRLEFGEIDGEVSARCTAIAQAMTGAGMEAVAVAHRHRIALAPTLPDEMVEIASTAPPQYKPSLLVDLEQGRRLEIEAWNGAIVRYGKQAGVPTPANSVIELFLFNGSR